MTCQDRLQDFSRTTPETRSEPARFWGTRLRPGVLLVGDTGIEPVASSVSGKRSPAELIALGLAEVETGFEPVYTALQAVASPLGHSTKVSPELNLAASERTTGLEPATFTLAR